MYPLRKQLGLVRDKKPGAEDWEKGTDGYVMPNGNIIHNGEEWTPEEWVDAARMKREAYEEEAAAWADNAEGGGEPKVEIANVENANVNVK